MKDLRYYIKAFDYGVPKENVKIILKEYLDFGANAYLVWDSDESGRFVELRISNPNFFGAFDNANFVMGNDEPEDRVRLTSPIMKKEREGIDLYEYCENELLARFGLTRDDISGIESY